MAGKFHHEELYRGKSAAETLANIRITLCGAGALGSNLADNLVRQGIQNLKVIDRDRVEEHNVSTQIYGECDVGAWKVDILRNRLFRTAGVEVDGVNKELIERNVRTLLKESDIVIDTFDNSASRQLVQDECRRQDLHCLHVGLFADYCEIVWDNQYRVPSDGGQDVCDYPLARNLVLLAVSIASESLVGFMLDHTQNNWSATLKDFSVRLLEPPSK